MFKKKKNINKYKIEFYFLISIQQINQINHP
jgi:hypothetical protein